MEPGIHRVGSKVLGLRTGRNTALRAGRIVILVKAGAVVRGPVTRRRHPAVPTVPGNVADAGAAKANRFVVGRSPLSRIAARVAEWGSLGLVRCGPKFSLEWRRTGSADGVKAHLCDFIADNGLNNRDHGELGTVVGEWQCGSRSHGFQFTAHYCGYVPRGATGSCLRGREAGRWRSSQDDVAAV